MRQLLVLLLLTLATGGAASAPETSSSQAPDAAPMTASTTGPNPVHITGDTFVVDDKGHTATFTGNVVVVRVGLNVWAPKVVIDYGAGGPSQINSFTATGGVRIKTPDQDATGDVAVYDPHTKLLHLTGHVIVINKTGTVGSPELVVNLETNHAVFTSKPGGRVTGVFTSQ